MCRKSDLCKYTKSDKTCSAKAVAPTVAGEMATTTTVAGTTTPAGVDGVLLAQCSGHAAPECRADAVCSWEKGSKACTVKPVTPTAAPTSTPSASPTAAPYVNPCDDNGCTPTIIGSNNVWTYDADHSDEFDSVGEISSSKWKEEMGDWKGALNRAHPKYYIKRSLALPQPCQWR